MEPTASTGKVKRGLTEKIQTANEDGLGWKIRTENLQAELGYKRCRPHCY